MNETWTGNIAVEAPLPKPNYSAGFRRSAFSGVFATSLFVATYHIPARLDTALPLLTASPSNTDGHPAGKRDPAVQGATSCRK